MVKYFCFPAFFFFLLNPVNAAKSPDQVIPVKVTVAPVIDGVLDEDVWNDSNGFTGFRSFIPDFGKEIPYGTTAWLSYDEENLYFAFRCLDNEPDKIRASVDSRDKIRKDDWVCVNFDSFNDQQSLYCIYVNPNGIQMDTRFAAGNEDIGMDLVWYSAGRINPDGYSVEIKLPLKSIRFSHRDPVMMSFFFERYVSRLSTNVSWPELDPAKGFAFFGQMQPVRFDGVKHYTLLEILPAVTYSYRGEQSGGKMTTVENKPDAGLTIKYGITSQLVLDATVNPDFSQVEADAGQVDVNLRYQLFYPEKRPFFQEGNETFKVGSAGSSSLDPMAALVHTRNIVNPLAGLKVSGKVGAKNSISLLYAADRVAVQDTGNYGRFAHMPVFRYKRSLKEDGFLGLIATSVLRENSYNYVYGADANIRTNKSSLLEFHSLFSNTNDTAAAIDNKSGHALGISYHSEQRNIDYAITAKDISSYFISQTGYIERTGITMITGSVTPRVYPDSKFFRRFDIGLFTGQTWDNIYDNWETYNSLTFTGFLGGSVRTIIGGNYSTEVYNNRLFNTSGFRFLLTGNAGTKLDGTFSFVRRNAAYYAGLSQAYGKTFTGDIRYLPSEKIHTQLTLTYQDLYEKADQEKIFDYLLTRLKVTYQANKYLYFRGILEYNDFRESLSTDFLASFTYIPGTVFHIGYGFLSEHREWNGTDYIESDRLHEMKRGFFVKISYMFRL
ncbi:MAG: carbohydrate binding family 9 domain-containing protein [Bacteroidales bacterium]|jgi:hypothetical protein|nr:carbohydrate binding family 9 domain-containing protein [Bacteroidales bacterium]